MQRGSSRSEWFGAPEVERQQEWLSERGMISRADRRDQERSGASGCRLRNLPLHCASRYSDLSYWPPGFVPQAVFPFS